MKVALTIDWRLYVLLDMGLLTTNNVIKVTEAVLAGGASVLQFRAKNWLVEDQLPIIEQILPLAHAYQVPLIINDHLDLVLATGADGVHLGSADLPVGLARKMVPNGLVGYSPDCLTDAHLAVEAGATYLGVGPFAPTLTKPDAGQPIQRNGLAAIVKAVPIPVIAIGGINTQNADQAIAAGAVGVAVASAVISSADPGVATRVLRTIIDTALSVQNQQRMSVC